MDFKNRVRLSNSTIYVLLFLFIFCLPLETVCSLPCSSTRLAPPRGAPDSWRAVVRRRNSFTPAKLGPNAVSSPHHAVEGALPSVGRRIEDARGACPSSRAAPPAGRPLGDYYAGDGGPRWIAASSSSSSSSRRIPRSARAVAPSAPPSTSTSVPSTSTSSADLASLSAPPAWARNATNPPLRGNFAPVEGE